MKNNMEIKMIGWNGNVATCNDIESLIAGTHGQGGIECSYSLLVASFGEPGEGDGYKTQAEWIVLTPAGNLHTRNNGGLSQTFSTDAANQLNSVTRTGTFTLNGATPAPATNVTVNGQVAQSYGDLTFALTNLSLANGTNSFTNIAQNAYGVRATNILTLNLPSSVTLNSDGNGNLTNDGMRTFGYDAENQLTNITLAGQWRSDFVYDGLNRRRIARDFSWSGSAWVQTNEVHCIYDGRLLIQERGTNNNTLVTYTRGLDLGGSLRRAGGIGGLLARTDTNGSTFYHADGAGNITALIDGTENIVARYLYNPFGKLTGQWGSLANVNTMQYSSKPIYRGIVDFGLRWYSPNYGRWLNQDPIQEQGGINLYEYVGNNPINFLDLYGLKTYFQNRWINGQTPLDSPISHTFVFTTNPDGSLANTYSWGNSTDPTGWNQNQPEDINAAKQAIQNMNNGKGDGSTTLADDSDDLDPYVGQAFRKLENPKNNHKNGWIKNNCKSEAKKLIDEAEDLEFHLYD